MRSVRGRAVGWLLLGAGLAPLLVWLGGIAPQQAVLLAAVGAGVVAVARFRPSTFDVAWPPPAAVNPDRGARREVARLSWAVGRGADSQVGSSSVRRLQDVARRRLERRGLHLDDPRDAERGVELVGTGPWQVLTAERGVGVRVSPAAFRSAVLAVERLGLPPTRRDAPREPSHQPSRPTSDHPTAPGDR